MEYFSYLFIFLFGLCFGSFLNAWVYRTRENIKITQGRSICPTCHRRLKWYENIPIFSFIFLKGKCHVCEKKISWQYPVVELSMGILFVAVAWLHGFHKFLLPDPELARDWVIVFVLAFVFLYDLKFREVLDGTTIPTALILFLFSMAMRWHTWQEMILGVAVGTVFFLLQYLISKGKWIGGGDIRLGLLIGVILAWPNVLIGLMVAYVIGAVTSIFLMLIGKGKLTGETPFGTYLAIGTFFAMFWGQELVDWYFHLLF